MEGDKAGDSEYYLFGGYERVKKSKPLTQVTEAFGTFMVVEGRKRKKKGGKNIY